MLQLTCNVPLPQGTSFYLRIFFEKLTAALLYHTGTGASFPALRGRKVWTIFGHQNLGGLVEMENEIDVGDLAA